MNAFMPSTTTKKITATGTTSSVTFTDNDKAGDAVRVYNANTEAAFLKFGVGAQTATANDLPIAPGAVEVIGVSMACDTFAAITAGSGGAGVYVTKGAGL